MRKYKPKPKLWTEKSLKLAVAEVAKGSPFYCVAEKYHMSRTLLDSRKAQAKKKRGRKTEPSTDVEVDIANGIAERWLVSDSVLA